MKLRKKLIDHVINGTALGMQPLPQIPLLEVMSNRRVLIENHRGIAVYGCQEIGVRVKYGWIYVYGRGLMVTEMSTERLLITGTVDEIKFIGMEAQ